jgi:hypothetical protein
MALSWAVARVLLGTDKLCAKPRQTGLWSLSGFDARRILA